MDHKILVVDDEAMVRNVIQRMLEKEDYQVKTVNSGQEAIIEFKKYQPALVILDLHLEDMNGLTVMSELKQLSSETLIILITAYADVETAVKAMKEGAYDFIQKPFMVEEMILIIRKAMETIQLRHEVKILRQIQSDRNDISPRLGKSPEMQRLLKKIEEIAVGEAPVLLTGEAGTEKELIAQYIHHLSHRFSKPLVKIDCEIPVANNLEEEFFEISKDQDEIALKNEWYEKLKDGTLLIKSIERTDLNFQARLIQYLQSQEPIHIRKNKPIFRLLATSIGSLADAVQAGDFNGDLYNFLKTGEIKMPPLRKHSEDILPMAFYFLERANHRFEKKITGFTPDAQDFLISMPFKENIRELRQLIDRLVFLVNNEYITVDDLTQTGLCESSYCFQLPVELNKMNRKEKIIPNVVQKIIAKTIKLTNGDITQAAQRLGLHESNLKAMLVNQTKKF